MAERAPTAVVADIAPKDRLRASINFGNPVLAQRIRRRPSPSVCLHGSRKNRVGWARVCDSPVVAFASQHRNLRVIEPSFMVIRQAMVVRKGLDAGLEYLHQFVEELKSSGFVADALRASGKAEVTVAPPSPRG